MKKKSSVPSASKIAAYAGAFLLLVAVIAIGYKSPQWTSNQSAVVSTSSNAPTVSSDDVTPSVDQVVATNIAADLASRANLSIATNIANMSISLAAKSDLAQTDTSAITKPQIIQPNGVRTEIINYTAVQGDSVSSVAAKFGLNADTVRSVNNLGNLDLIETGKTLTILPTNGILHVAQAGDTVESIASKYKANADRITLINNLELSNISPNQKIIVPDGVMPVVVPAAPQASSLSSATVQTGLNINVSAGNRYAPGYCTWWAYERRMQLGRPIGSYWGNATTWDIFARQAGFRVDNVPEPGAIYEMKAFFDSSTGGAGHVGIVESLNSNGSVNVSDMNYAGNFNKVTYRTVPANIAARFIYIH